MWLKDGMKMHVRSEKLLLDPEKLKEWKFEPGAFIPLECDALIMFADSPASFHRPVDWSKTRWPEGAEL